MIHFVPIVLIVVNPYFRSRLLKMWLLVLNIYLNNFRKNRGLLFMYRISVIRQMIMLTSYKIQFMQIAVKKMCLLRMFYIVKPHSSH